jgi:Undecaprenyl-phosphate galactose phosphotransferase WbaP
LQLLTVRSKEPLSGAEVASFQFPEAAWRASWSLWWPRVVRVAVLFLTDMTALLLAASLGYLLWARFVLNQPLSVYIDLVPLLLLFPVEYAAAGLYPGFGVGAVETLRRIASCTSLAFLVMAAASFVFKLPPHYSRMSFTIAWGVSLVCVPLLRFLMLALANRWEWWGEPAVLVGGGQWVQGTIRALQNALSLGYRPMWVLSPDIHWHGRAVEGVPVLGRPELAPSLAKRGVRVAFMSESGGSSNGSTLSWFQQHFRHVVIIQESQDFPIERVRICNLGGMFGIEFTNNLLRLQNRVIKRTLDLVLGTFFLVFASPMIAFAALSVKLLSRGPFFFHQTREGMGGSLIKVWKLRTMYQDAESRLETFLSTDPELRRQWEHRFKLTRDPRIIPVIGPFLRRFSVDELPQLWSVVQGKMSLVGPRPFPEYHLQQLPPEFRELRRRVRPGLTGMWQVMVRSNGGIAEQIIYDTYYIRNWSLWVDLYILARTIFVVLAGRGAY